MYIFFCLTEKKPQFIYHQTMNASSRFLLTVSTLRLLADIFFPAIDIFFSLYFFYKPPGVYIALL